MAQLLKIVATIFVTGFVLNLIWEILQTILFFNFPWEQTKFFIVIHISATLGDTCYILLIYFLGLALTRKVTWFGHLNCRRLAGTMLAGFLIAVAIERRALDAGRWSYNLWMPLIPYLQVGLTPVLQMTILPLTTYLIANKLLSGQQGRQGR